MTARVDSKIELRVENAVTKFLGNYMYYDRDQGFLEISHFPLVDATLIRFGLKDTNTVASSVSNGVRIEQA